MAIVQSRVAAVQAIYAAYYNRPADVGGLDFWTNQLQAANGNLSTIINAFGNSAEANALYTGSTENRVNQVYQALFGRAADVAGLNFYTAEIAAGRISLAGAAQAIAAGAQGADATAFTNKVAAATLFTNSLDTAAEVLAYSQNGAADKGRAFLAGVNATTTATQATVDAAIVGLDTGSVATLTSQTDTVTANIINSGLVFTPGGDDRVNALQDEDTLNGTGVNPTLNLTLGNANDNGASSISPTVNGVQTLNVTFSGNSDAGQTAASRLDLQNSTGNTGTTINIRAINDIGSNKQIDNVTSVTTAISLANSVSPQAVVGVNFAAGVLAGAADATTIALSRVNVAGLSVEDSGTTLPVGATGAATGRVGLSDGFEAITLNSGTAPNRIGAFSAEDLRTLTITGAANLALGTTANTVGAQGVEATRYGAGLANVSGSLTAVDASAFTGNLDYTIGGEINGNLDNTSGQNVNMTITGGAGNDTFRLATGASVNPADRIIGGAGNNTLQLLGGNTISAQTGTNAPTVTGVQTLDIRTGHDADTDPANETVNIDGRAIADLTSATIRNEGQTVGVLVNGVFQANVNGNVFGSANEASVINFTNLNAATTGALTVLHGTTGNNGINNNAINVISTLAGVTTAGLTIADGINNDPQFNLRFRADSDGTQLNTTNTIVNVNLVDNDTELNTVQLTEFQQHTGTLTITGTSANFLNLDATANAYRYAQDGTARNGTEGAPGVRTEVGSGAAERLQFSTIDSTAYAGNVILRAGLAQAAGSNGAQTIRFGAGNDTVIFDVLNSNNAGFTNADTLSGGAGADVLAIDGNNTIVTVQASEFQNTTGFEIIRFLSNGGIGGLAGRAAGGPVNGIAVQANQAVNGATSFGQNSYNLSLSDALITSNAANGRLITIINDNDSRNDDGVISAAENTTQTNFVNAGGAAGAVTQSVGITIDARQLSSGFGFNYNGEEASASADATYTRNATYDRFIFADRNINGSTVIDGGAIYAATVTAGGPVAPVGTNFGSSNLASGDVLEVRNSATVDAADLANIRNVGHLQFTNDTTTLQTSNIELNNVVVDALVNTTQVAGALINNVANPAEVLTIQAIDNIAGGNVIGQTNINLNGAGVTNAALQLSVTGGSAVDTIIGGAGNDTIDGGIGADIITGGAGNDNLTGGQGADTFIFADSAAANGSDTFVDFVAGAAGDVLNFSAFNIDGNGAANVPGALSAVLTANPGATDVSGTIVRLVDIAAGQDIATTAGLQAAVAVGGEYANIDMAANRKAIIITSATNGADADQIFFATSDGTGAITVTLVGTTNNVAIGDYVVGNFVI